MKRLSTTFVLIVLATLGLFAQDKKSEPKSPTPIEVSANFLVVDSKDQYVSDLKIEHIRVFEDGVEQKVNYIAKKDTALHLGLVVDNSGSLRNQLEEILQAAAILTQNLRANDEAFVVRFISSEKIELLQDWTSDKPQILKAIDSMFIEGGQSAVNDALALAAQKLVQRQKEKSNEKFAIVLVSDCDDLSSFYTLDQMLSLLKGTEIQIFPFAFTGGLSSQRGFLGKGGKAKAVDVANKLSLRTGGNAYFLDKKITSDVIMANLKSLALELRSQYVIGFTSTNPSPGTTRKLTVEIRNRPDATSLKTHIRESYTVPKN